MLITFALSICFAQKVKVMVEWLGQALVCSLSTTLSTTYLSATKGIFTKYDGDLYHILFFQVKHITTFKPESGIRNGPLVYFLQKNQQTAERAAGM
jgi:hypothetical protein